MLFHSTKICTRCGIEKSFDDFYRKPGGRFGLQPKCKECDRATSRAYRVANAERLREYDRARYWRDPETQREQARRRRQRKNEGKAPRRKLTPEEIKATIRARYQRDREAWIERAKQWYRANGEQARARIRANRLNNPDRENEYSRRRRARQKGSGGTFGVAD